MLALNFFFPATAAFLLVAAWLDLKSGKIPNRFNALFFVFSAAANFANSTVSLFLLFLAVAFALSLAVYYAGAWAGGDAKFFTILSSALPLFGTADFKSVFILFLASALFLGVFFLLSGRIKQLKTGGVNYLEREDKLAFAPFLALGFLLTVLS
ncbi:MAG: A24 family peptidase [Candidatus Micrarchaeota archaeon]